MNRRNVIISVSVFVLLTGLVLTRGPHGMRRIQSGFLGMISPFLKSGSSMEKKYREFREGLKTLDQLEQENGDLKVRNKELSTTNQVLRGFEAENKQLRKALQYRASTTFNLKPARIIARDASTWYNKIIIDRGFEDGLDRNGDQPVLTEAGLVGKTTVVDDHTSTVVLIADETCKVSANVESTREQGIVRGERASNGAVPSIVLNFLSKQAALKPGQNVLTSGAGGVFPSGVVIGQVREFKARELDGQATIIPSVDFTTLEDVFVVIGKTKTETE
ncbi:MAG: rod shape-determining protein MreC [Chthoniobacter sp.]|nr:rod shape-determining protein MreC [Chthoniobacter sp.]